MSSAVVVSVASSVAPAPSSTTSWHTCCPTLDSPTCAHTEGTESACRRFAEPISLGSAAPFPYARLLLGPFPLAPESPRIPALLLLSPFNSTDFQSSYLQDLPTSPDWEMAHKTLNFCLLLRSWQFSLSWAHIATGSWLELRGSCPYWMRHTCSRVPVSPTHFTLAWSV